MQPGLGVTTNVNSSGEATDIFMYFAATFEGFRQSFFLSECVAFFAIGDSFFFFFFPLCLLNVSMFWKGTVFVLINQKRSVP